MKTLGEIAYEAYCASREWKSIVGDPLPSFAQMRTRHPAIAEAWEKAGTAVAAHVALQTGRG